MGGACGGEHVVAEDEVDEDGENEVVDDRVAINGVDDGVRGREMRLNAVGVGADDAAPRAPIVNDLENLENEEEEGGENEVFDDRVAINGVDDGVRELEMRLNAIGVRADDIAPRAPIVNGLENEEEEDGENEVFDDRVAINGVDDGVRGREMRLNAIGVGADDAAPRAPIGIDLGNEEEEDGENEVFDDRVAINGDDDGVREREMRLNAIGVGANGAAPRDPIVINLGNQTDAILVGDLPIHGFQYQEILRTCPPLEED